MARVLIGIDGSALARRAAVRALDLLGGSPEVTFLHVVRPAPRTAPVAGAGFVMSTVDERQLAEATQAMSEDAEADVAATVRELGIDATGLVVLGEPGDELCRLAGEGRFELLVIGSHGSGFLKRVLLGSVSHHVLHHAPCPVLVVRDADDHESDDDGSGPA